MDHDTLDRLRQTHAAWRLLAADHAPLILSFFALAFIQPNRRTIPRSGEDAEFDLTPTAERAIEWIEGLRPQEFVGTDSPRAPRRTLRRVSKSSSVKAEIERDIERVRSGQSGPFDTTQVKERTCGKPRMQRDAHVRRQGLRAPGGKAWPQTVSPVAGNLICRFGVERFASADEA